MKSSLRHCHCPVSNAFQLPKFLYRRNSSNFVVHMLLGRPRRGPAGVQRKILRTHRLAGNEAMRRARFHCCAHHVAAHVGTPASETNTRTRSFQQCKMSCHSSDQSVREGARTPAKLPKSRVKFFQLFFVKCPVPRCKASNRGNTRIKIFQPAPNSSVMIEKKVFVGPKSFRRLL